MKPPRIPGSGMIRFMDSVCTSIYDRLWGHLEEGSANRRHAFHTPVLATRSASGDPDLRTVVLRRVDRAQRIICCHTDHRAPKVRAIRAHWRVIRCVLIMFITRFEFFHKAAAKIPYQVGGTNRTLCWPDCAYARTRRIRPNGPIRSLWR